MASSLAEASAVCVGVAATSSFPLLMTAITMRVEAAPRTSAATVIAATILMRRSCAARFAA
ncbi:hypothetical protein GCM10025876_39450 [Demequina litorisediminis]|uniref:Secreted protein n=1 Tax=Demequina litorisediminis TaxID=1849022 RepID=A0ABQ6IKX5_9MICO|nr:hypothetical protein GCM10025876_39450 [Demequina litorisediminis]